MQLCRQSRCRLLFLLQGAQGLGLGQGGSVSSMLAKLLFSLLLLLRFGRCEGQDAPTLSHGCNQASGTQSEGCDLDGAQRACILASLPPVSSSRDSAVAAGTAVAVRHGLPVGSGAGVGCGCRNGGGLTGI